MRRHSRPEFADPEGLHDVVVSPDPQTVHQILLLRLCRDEQDRAVYQFSDLTAQGKAVRLRHHHIQKDQLIPVERIHI